MAQARCPDCGAPISPGAVVCPTCGFPLRPDALARGGPGGGGSGSGKTVIVIALVACGLFAVMFVGVIAALAIPRFAAASARAREKQGETLLKMAYTAEQAYFAEHGMYTSSVDSLKEIVGPAADSSAARYTLEISAASDRDLCLEAVPVPGSGVGALSMDVTGMLYRTAGCSGDPDITVPVGTGGDVGARRMMREVHESIVVYRAKHGGEYPRTLSDVVTRVHDSPAMGEYTFKLVRGDEQGVCAAVVPRSVDQRLTTYSVDHDGNLYEGAQCTGTPVDRFDVDAAAEPGSAAEPPSADDTVAAPEDVSP
ncbi:MAG TPA: zinc ribbon domain-containing protein [Longimicrobium sp.]|nr:zinc ribbon domain-containing protein [Longimicrobium sp.]